MKPVIQFTKPAAMLCGLLLTLPVLADKGGIPNDGGGNAKRNSTTDIAICANDDATEAFVCAGKELSNVVLGCADGFVKFDDLEAIYEGTFACEDGGTINSVSAKAGTSVFVYGAETCPVECPVVIDETEEEEPEGEELPQ